MQDHSTFGPKQPKSYNSDSQSAAFCCKADALHKKDAQLCVRPTIGINRCCCWAMMRLACDDTCEWLMKPPWATSTCTDPCCNPSGSCRFSCCLGAPPPVTPVPATGDTCTGMYDPASHNSSSSATASGFSSKTEFVSICLNKL